MATEHNAIANLAERLKGKIELHAYYNETERQDDIKAQRIVAELAKVQTEPYQDCVQAYYASRAIAEEGVEDEP